MNYNPRWNGICQEMLEQLIHKEIESADLRNMIQQVMFGIGRRRTEQGMALMNRPERPKYVWAKLGTMF